MEGGKKYPAQGRREPFSGHILDVEKPSQKSLPISLFQREESCFI
jgi:hypothetical protein